MLEGYRVGIVVIYNLIDVAIAAWAAYLETSSGVSVNSRCRCRPMAPYYGVMPPWWNRPVMSIWRIFRLINRHVLSVMARWTVMGGSYSWMRKWITSRGSVACIVGHEILIPRLNSKKKPKQVYYCMLPNGTRSRNLSPNHTMTYIYHVVIPRRLMVFCDARSQDTLKHLIDLVHIVCQNLVSALRMKCRIEMHLGCRWNTHRVYTYQLWITHICVHVWIIASKHIHSGVSR